MSLEKNVAARKAAEEAFAKLKGGLNGKLSHEHFWRVMTELCAASCGMALVVEGHSDVMEYDEAVAFEKSYVPRGRHAGKQVRDISTKEITRAVYDPFSVRLRRYAASARFQSRVIG